MRQEEEIKKIIHSVQAQSLLSQEQIDSLNQLLHHHPVPGDTLFSTVNLISLAELANQLSSEIDILEGEYSVYLSINNLIPCLTGCIMVVGLLTTINYEALTGDTEMAGPKTSLNTFLIICGWLGVALGCLFYKTLNTYKLLNQYVPIHNDLVTLLRRQERLIGELRGEQGEHKYAFNAPRSPVSAPLPLPTLRNFLPNQRQREERPQIPAAPLPIGDEAVQPLLPIQEDALPRPASPRHELLREPLLGRPTSRPAPASPRSPSRGRTSPALFEALRTGGEEKDDKNQTRNLVSEIKATLSLDQLTPEDNEKYILQLNSCQAISDSETRQHALERLKTEITQAVMKRITIH